MTASILAAVEAAHEPIAVLWTLAGGLVLLALLLGSLAVVFQIVTNTNEEDEEDDAESSEADLTR